MKRRLVQSSLLIVVVAALMMGGDFVQEGKQEMWLADPGVSIASTQGVKASGSASGANQIADMVSDEMVLTRNSCPKAHRSF